MARSDDICSKPSRGLAGFFGLPIRKTVFLSMFSVVALAGFVGGCTTNPVTGKSQLVTLMSAEDEAAAGADAHPKILAAYGGAYNDPRVGQYVAQVTQRITRAIPQQGNRSYRVTVLNSPIVNAFALPGGYVYVTRGLLALVDDEAELAGVMGHEIGHVVARHGAQRQTAALGASVIGAVIGAVGGSPALNQVVGLGSQGVIASYSRDQEYEADGLGVRFLAAAGYDPYAQADFLAAMDENAKVEALIAGRAEPQPDWLASHPATPERVAAARRAAAATGVPRGKGDRNRAALFKAINGMVYGEAREQGLVRGQRFIHPVERFRFDAPKGFRIVNGPSAVMVLGPDKAIAKFDEARKNANMGIDVYLARVWASGVAISPVQRMTIGGLPAASANARIGAYDGRLVAIDGGQGKVFRFLLGLPHQNANRRYAASLDSIAQSFRRISAAEAARVKTLRVRIVTVRRGDSMASLARRMAFPDHQLDRFRALNGLPVGAVLQAGRQVKIVTE